MTDKLEDARLRALGEWIKETSDQGVTDTKIVTMLLSETVRAYKIVYSGRPASHLIEWVTRLFHSKLPSAPKSQKSDGWGSN